MRGIAVGNAALAKLRVLEQPHPVALLVPIDGEL
jgi:hypothetical protein